MFRLIATIPAHDGPIKAISSKNPQIIITGGQDSTVKVWNINKNKDIVNINESIHPLYHSHWITSVTNLNSNCHSNYPNGLIITGCMDNIIRLFDLSGNLLGQLVGHEKPVISFSWTNNYQLVSGSWDGTARLWNLENLSCIRTFNGHENGVHVLSLNDDNNTLITVSTGEQVNNKPANFRLRLFNLLNGQLLGKPIEDHSGPIRSVFLVPKIGFATTSNDGTLCLRDNTGNCVGVCTHDPQDEGYPPFLLDGTSISFPDSIGGTVTCGEDGSVVIWKGTERFQSIPHPSCVWAVCTLGDLGNDFITACHDGFFRIFSRDNDLCNHPTALDLQLQLELEVESAKIAKRRGPSQEEIQKSPKWEDRTQIPGTSEGQVRIFNKNGIAIAAQWSAISYTWIEIGEVTGSAGTSDGGILNGISYDHIIPVEIETPGGLRKLQLGYNDTESHFTAAQRFIDENVLDQGYLRQIADFIAARSGNSQPTIDMSSQSSSGGGGGVASSASSAIPAPSISSNINLKSNLRTFKTFPSTIYYIFDDVPSVPQLRKIFSKINELNDNIDNENAKLNSSELELLQDLIRILGETSYYHSSIIQPNLLNPIIKIIQLWSNDQNLFPIYDILRMLCLHPSGGSVLSRHRHFNTILTRSISILNNDVQLSLQGTPHSLLNLRFFANLFKNNDLRNNTIQFLINENILNQLQEIITFQMFSEKKTHRIANFNFICNFFFSQFNSLLSTNNNNSNNNNSNNNITIILQIFFPQFLSILRTEVEIFETIFHGLVTLGTILTNIQFSDIILNYLNENNFQIPILLNSLKQRWYEKEKAILEYIEEVEIAYEIKFKR